MSNYCDGCRYKPGVRSGPNACPMTVMYWDFVARHEGRLEGNPRTLMMVRNLRRFGTEESDGAPDFNRRMAVNTPYGGWFAQVGAA